jgi:eukaryotic-like serine/threonine-protein kinase
MDCAVVTGQVVAGKYRVERVLGEGGMGTVVAASHLFLPHRVAIKILREEDNPEHCERFIREARAVVRLKGEHVVRVLEVGQLDTSIPYIVMEYLEGQDLGALLRERGRLDVQEAAEYVLQACLGMAEAHAAGIVHRDLKPANLFLVTAPDGSRRVKVLDFGISKELPTGATEQAASLTKTRQMLGSPCYMSPEQMRSSRSVDARSDIWALGALLFRLVIGYPPFNGVTITEIILKVSQSEPPRPSELRPEIPPEFERIILRCLEKVRGRRFASVTELAQALAPFASQSSLARAEGAPRILAAIEPQQARDGAAAGVAPGGDADFRANTTRRMSDVPVVVRSAPPRSATRPLFLSAAALVLGIGVAAVAAVDRPRPGTPEAPDLSAASGPAAAGRAARTLDDAPPAPQDRPAEAQGDAAAPQPPSAEPPAAKARTSPALSATSIKSARPAPAAPTCVAPPGSDPNPFSMELK